MWKSFDILSWTAEIISVDFSKGKEDWVLSHLSIGQDVHNILEDNIFYIHLKNKKYALFSENVYSYFEWLMNSPEKVESITHIKGILNRFFIELDPVNHIYEYSYFYSIFLKLISDLDRFLGVELYNELFLDNLYQTLNLDLNRFLCESSFSKGDKIFEAVSFFTTLEDIPAYMPNFDLYLIQTSISCFIFDTLDDILLSHNYDNISPSFSRWCSIAGILRDEDIIDIFKKIDSHIESLIYIQDAEGILHQLKNLESFFKNTSPDIISQICASIRSKYDELPFDHYRSGKVVKFSQVTNS